MRPQGVIFDMDGTLANTEPIHMIAEKRMLSQLLEGRELTVDLDSVGRPAVDVYGDVIDFCGKTGRVSPEEITVRHHEIVLDILRLEQVEPEPGVMEVLDFCREKGIACAIASSSPRMMVEGLLKLLGIRDRFSVVVCVDDGVQAKPSPEPYMRALQLLGMLPCACVSVEDSQVGLTSALGAGLRCYGYINPDSGPQDLSRAWKQIHRIDEILLDFG